MTVAKVVVCVVALLALGFLWGFAIGYRLSEKRIKREHREYFGSQQTN